MEKAPSQIDYWDEHTDEFDAIYSHEKSGFSNLLDAIFRKDMYQRFQFTLDRSQPISGRSFLDAGCGPGYYSLELARRGAKSVTGIDYSDKMIQMANQRLVKENLQDNCRFQVKDILDFDSESKFDISIAMGLFDYIEDPVPALKRMKALTTDRMILSFPRLYTWRAPVRKVRLKTKKLPVFFYSRKRLKAIFGSAGFKRYERETVGKLHCVVVFMD